MHKTHARAGEQGPANLPATPVAPPGGKCQEGEEDQQDFVDVVAAVEDHRRRSSRKKGGPQRRVPAQAVRDERQQQNQADAKENGDEPELALRELVDSLRRPRQAADGEGGVVERRAVMLVGVCTYSRRVPKADRT